MYITLLKEHLSPILFWCLLTIQYHSNLVLFVIGINGYSHKIMCYHFKVVKVKILYLKGVLIQVEEDWRLKILCSKGAWPVFTRPEISSQISSLRQPLIQSGGATIL
jgi:hypothetical protein